jgi:hypothetical protein
MGTKKKQVIKIPKTIKFLGKRYKLKLGFCMYLAEGKNFMVSINRSYYGNINAYLSIELDESRSVIDASGETVQSAIDNLETNMNKYFNKLGDLLGYEIEG